MAYEALVRRADMYRVVLEEHVEGTYIFIFRRPGSSGPDEDQLQDNVEMAMRVCEEDYRIPRDVWKEIPNPGLM
jgi:hypothetical protein